MTDFNLKLIFQAIDKVSAPAGKMAKAIGSLSRNAGLDQVAKSGAAAGRALGTTAKEAAKVAGALSLAAGGTFAFVKNYANTGDVIAKTADKLGVGVEALQRLEHHAELSGVASGSLHDSLRFLLNGAGEAAKGMGPLKETFASLGIAVTDGNGRLKDAESLMFEVADAMAKIEDPAARVSIAQDIFGRSGVDLINALKGGAGAMKESGKEAERLGIITDAQAREAEVFNDAITRLTRVLSNIGFLIANQLMPPLTEFAGWLKEVSIEARPEIVGRFSSALETLKNVLPSLTSGMGAVIAVVATVVGWVAQAIEISIGWERAGQLLATFFGLKLAQSIWTSITAMAVFIKSLILAAAKMLFLGGRAALSMITGLGKLTPALFGAARAAGLMALALLANPLAWIVGAVVLAAGAAWLLWENWDQVAAYLKGLWDEVTAAFDQGFLQGMMTLLEKFNPTQLLADGINSMIKYLFGIDLAAIGSEWISGFTDAVWEQIRELMTMLPDAIKEGLSFLPDSWLAKLGLGAIGGDASGLAATSGTGAVPSALTARQSGFKGELEIRIPGAPPGTRVDTVRKQGSDDFDLMTDVGYAMQGG